MRPSSGAPCSKEFPIGDFFTRVTRRGEPFDLAVSGHWMAPDPVQILAALFDGSMTPRATTANISHFNDPEFSRKLHAVAKLSGAERSRAAARLTFELQRDALRRPRSW